MKCDFPRLSFPFFSHGRVPNKHNHTTTKRLLDLRHALPYGRGYHRTFTAAALCRCPSQRGKPWGDSLPTATQVVLLPRPNTNYLLCPRTEDGNLLRRPRLSLGAVRAATLARCARRMHNRPVTHARQPVHRCQVVPCSCGVEMIQWSSVWACSSSAPVGHPGPPRRTHHYQYACQQAHHRRGRDAQLGPVRLGRTVNKFG